MDRLEYFARQVRDRFAKDLEQGYRTKDKEFAVDLLNKALEGRGDDLWRGPTLKTCPTCRGLGGIDEPHG